MFKSLSDGRFRFFAIFAAMKKWLVSYMLLVCSISLHICGFANPAKTSRTAYSIKSSYTTSPRTFTFKKASASLYSHSDENSTGIFFQPHNIRVLYSEASYYSAGQNFFLTISRHVPGEAISKREVERVLKDHLLHLFPSHYFW